MLSEPEQRMLHQIENSMASSDPGLAARMSAPWHRGRRGVVLVHDLVCAFSLVLGVACVLLGQVGPGLAALVFAAVVLQTRRIRFGDPRWRRLTRPRGRRPGQSR